MTTINVDEDDCERCWLVQWDSTLHACRRWMVVDPILYNWTEGFSKASRFTHAEAEARMEEVVENVLSQWGQRELDTRRYSIVRG